MTDKLKNVLYIHGMGGGGDSRIPSILKKEVRDDINIVVRTYDFNPDIASVQIRDWVEELKPSLIIGESLGSIHAIAIKGYPHLLVSPSLNAPGYLSRLSFLTLFPGMQRLIGHIFKPKPGDRQTLHFTYGNIHKWLKYRKIALDNSPREGSHDSFFAFFGTKDHYRRSGIVRVGTYRKFFGNTYKIYRGTHFMEEEYVISMLIPKMYEMLGIKDSEDTASAGNC